MRRTLAGCFIAVCGPRQNEAKSSAVIEACLVLENAAVFFDDARGNGQTEAGAAFLGGKERIEEALFRFWGHAFAGVGNFNHDHVTMPFTQNPSVRASSQRDRAILADAFGGVLHKVDNDLLDLLRVDRKST